MRPKVMYANFDRDARVRQIVCTTFDRPDRKQFPLRYQDAASRVPWMSRSTAEK